MSNRNRNSTDAPSTDAEPTGGRQLRLPESVAGRIDQRIVGTEFDSVDAYVAFVVESVLREIDEQTDEELDTHDVSDRATDEGDAMEERLESLGYL